MKNGTLITVIIFVAIIFSATSCLSSLEERKNTLVKQLSNPQRTQKAILFLMNSALSSDSYQVSIVVDDFKLNNFIVGNTFTVDTNHGETGLDSASINLTWLGNDTLQIDYDKKLRTFITENKIYNVFVIYKPR